MSGLTRLEFEAIWAQLDREAEASGFSEQAFLRLVSFYRELDADDRAVVDAVLTEWVGKGDAGQQYDALGLIDEFEIRSALPALRKERARLDDTVGPSVPDDREWLDGIIDRLEAAGET